MKKSYEAPKAEVVKFEYKDQVVADSTGGGCKYVVTQLGTTPTSCDNPGGSGTTRFM